MEKLAQGNWLHAMDPDRFQDVSKRTDYYEAEDHGFVDEDLPIALKFIHDYLLSIDPTKDQKYFKKLCGYFDFSGPYENGMTYNQSQKVAELLRDYESLKAKYPDLSSDPFQLYKEKDDPFIGRRAIPKNPMHACRTPHHLENFIDHFKQRKSRGKLWRAGDIPDDIDPANMIHREDDFCAYHAIDQMRNKAICIELPNGARYYIVPRHLWGQYITIHDENRNICMPEKLFRTLDGLAEVIAPFFIDGKRGKEHNILAFAYTLRAAQKSSVFEDGVIAQAFQKKYERIVEEEEKTILNEEERDTDRYRSWSEIDREERYHCKRFHDLFADLSALAYFQADRKLVDADFIKTILHVAGQAGAARSIRQGLEVIQTVPQWRNALTAQDIAPTLETLATQTHSQSVLKNVILDVDNEIADEFNYRVFEDYVETHQYLARMMAFLSRAHYWIDGSEAEYLPKAIDHTLQTKDFTLLKPLLWRAAQPNDPVSKMWRDSIPESLRDEIETYKFDNTYKNARIHLLMDRLRKADNRDCQLYGLKHMPTNPREVQAFEQECFAKQIRRARKKRRALTA